MALWHQITPIADTRLLMRGVYVSNALALERSIMVIEFA